MDKTLTVYPIATGDMLNVFASELISSLKIMDMNGKVWLGLDNVKSKKNTIDIKQLPGATYIVEVLFADHRLGRSVFVKI